MKKLINIFLILALVLSSFTYAFAQPVTNATKEEMIEYWKEHSKEDIEKYIEQIDEIKKVLENDKVSVIVELKDKPLLEDKSAISMGATNYLKTSEAGNRMVALESSQANVKKAIKEIDSNAVFGYNYNLIINGFEITVTADNIREIKKIPEVKNIYVNRKYLLPTPQMVSSTDMVFPDETQKFTGAGTAVAVIDSGIDASNVLMRLTKAGKDNLKIMQSDVEAKLKDLKAKGEGLTAEALYFNEKVPYQFDYTDGKPDASTDGGAGGNEHGVHVSGTIGANKNEITDEEKAKLGGKEINGIAPETQILGFKVFDSRGAAMDEWIFAAVEDAITLGVDSINLSLGSPCGFTLMEGVKEPSEMAMVFEKARKAGVVVAVAASNDNRTGNYAVNNYDSLNPLAANPDTSTIGDPASKEYATTVASFENSKITSPYFKHNDKEIKYIEAEYPENKFDRPFATAIDGKLFVDCGIGNPDEFPKDKKGYIALVKRGTLNFADKSYNSAQAGASACVIYNDGKGVGDDEPLDTSLASGDYVNTDIVPTVGITRADGLAILKALDKPADAKGEYVDTVPSPIEGEMSSFSSWGCNPDLKLKPEILAPGGRIYSTISNNRFEIMSGTSMATPHVAGGAAVVGNFLNSKGLYKGDLAKKSQVVEALIMSTAVPQVDKDSKVTFSPRQQGAGMMNLTAATKSVTYLLDDGKDGTNKAKLELGDNLAAGTPKSFAFTIHNEEAEARTYTLSGKVLIEKGEDKDGTTFITNEMKELTASNVKFDNETVTVGPNSTAKVTGTITLDAGEMNAQSQKFINGFFVEGFITLKSEDKNTYPDLGIPYLGYYDNWDKAPLFDTLNYKEDIAENGGVKPFFKCTKLYSVDGESLYDIGRMLMGSGAESNMVYLGEDYSGEKSGSQYVAISPADYEMGEFFDTPVNLYQSRDYAYFSAETLRNARVVNFRVLGSDKKTVVSSYINGLKDKLEPISSFEYCRKSIFLGKFGTVVPGICSFIDLSTPEKPMFLGWDAIYWDGTDSNGKIVPDGQYYIEVTGCIDKEGARMDSILLPVKVDNTAPKAEMTATREGEKISSVEIKAKDNYYLDYVEGTYDFKYVDSNGFDSVLTVDILKAPMKFVGEGSGSFTQEDLKKGIEAAIEYQSNPQTGDLVKEPENMKKLVAELEKVTFEKLTFNAVDSAANRGKAAVDADVKVISAKAKDKVYDGTKTATVTDVVIESTVQGLAEGTDYTVKAEFAKADVGENIPVTLTVELVENEKTKGLILDNRVTDLKANITPKAITVESFQIKNKEYDGTTTAEVTSVTFKGAVTPLEMGKDFEATAVFDSPNASKDAPLTLTITCKNPNYTIESPVKGAAVIAPKTIEAETVKVADKVYDGTTDAKVTSVTLKGALEEQTLGKDFEATAVFDSPNAAKDAPATVTLKSLNPNYLIKSPVKTTATIAPKELTLASAKVEDKTYDGKTDAKVSKVVFDPKADLKEGKDYDAVAAFKSPDANKEAIAVVSVNMKNTNYVVKNQLEVKATINKADRECPLKYKVDIKDGKYTITIEPVKGAEYNFGNGWTKSNVFETTKSGKFKLSIRIPEDKNYNEAKSETTIKLTPEGAVPTGDNTQIVLWVALMAVAVAIAGGARLYSTKKK